MYKILQQVNDEPYVDPPTSIEWFVPNNSPLTTTCWIHGKNKKDVPNNFLNIGNYARDLWQSALSFSNRCGSLAVHYHLLSHIRRYKCQHLCPSSAYGDHTLWQSSYWASEL